MSVSAATEHTVRPNRRGMKSRELVLDAAERVMATDGFEAATVAGSSRSPGSPSAPCTTTTARRTASCSPSCNEAPTGSSPICPTRHAGRQCRRAPPIGRLIDRRGLERHPAFLRLLIGFAVQPPAASDGEVADVVRDVRRTALRRLRKQIALAFGDEPSSPVTERLARFALAAFDGAFVANRSDKGATLAKILEPLPTALVAIRHAKD